MSIIVPAGTTLVFSAFRLQAGALAQSFLLTTTKPIDSEDLAHLARLRAPELVDRAATAGSQLVLTLNLIDDRGHGGCSWQCLYAHAPVERSEFLAAVGAYLADMTLHAALCHASTPAAAPAPRTLN